MTNLQQNTQSSFSLFRHICNAKEAGRQGDREIDIWSIEIHKQLRIWTPIIPVKWRTNGVVQFILIMARPFAFATMRSQLINECNSYNCDHCFWKYQRFLLTFLRYVSVSVLFSDKIFCRVDVRRFSVLGRHTFYLSVSG